MSRDGDPADGQGTEGGAERASEASGAIRTDEEYAEAVRQLQRDRRLIPAQRRELAGLGLGGEEVEAALETLLAHQKRLAAEIARYERSRGGGGR